MKKAILPICALLLLFSECKNRSNCLIDSRSGEILINDTSKVTRVMVFVSESDSFAPLKAFDVNLMRDSLVNKTSYIYIYTSDFRSTYFRKMKPSDWNKDKILKCSYYAR